MIKIIAHKDYQNVQVVSDSLGKLDKLLTYMNRKIYESIGNHASVQDLYEWVDASFIPTNTEMMNWVWTSLEEAKIDRDFDNYTLSMPPARKHGMINPNLHQIMEEKYYPLTLPPKPAIGPKVVYPKSKYMDYVLNISRKDGKSMKHTMDICKAICGTKMKLEVSDELNCYSGPMYMPLTVPSREEIIKDICVFKDYDVVRDQFIIIMKYENELTELTISQKYAINSDSRILCDADYFDMWRSARREKLISAVTKAYENKKKEQEKEKLKMFLDNSDAVCKKIYKYATNFEIESRAGEFSTATIECPVYNLKRLLGLDDNTAKKPTSDKSVEITNIEMYNDRVVKVTFDDGSFTKSVCQENDIFDLDVGITVCLMKKMLDDGKGNGTRIYNNIIRDAHKLINDKENEKIEKQMEKEKQKKKAHKAMMKKQAKKMKAKEEAIDTQKLAFIRALQETGMIKDVE